MSSRRTRRSLFAFIATAIALIASDFAFATFRNHFWRAAVCVLLVAAFGLIVLISRSCGKSVAPPADPQVKN